MPRWAHHLRGQPRTVVDAEPAWPPVQRDELTQDPRQPHGGDRRAHLDCETHPIPFVDHVQGPEPPATIERVVHEVERPHLVQACGRDQDLPKARRYPAARPPWEIQAQRAVHAMDALVIPRVAI